MKRAKQSIGLEHRDQLLKDIDGLSLERYVDEIATAIIEGVARCKNDKDVWSATEVCLHPFAPTRRGVAYVFLPFVVFRSFLSSTDASSQHSHRRSYRSYSRVSPLPRVSHTDPPRPSPPRCKSARRQPG